MRIRKKRSAFRIYFAALIISIVTVLFIYTASTVYINTSQVALGSDMSIIEAQRQDGGTFAVEIVGKRWYVDITPVRKLEKACAQEYYYMLPPSVRIGAPVVDRIKELIQDLVLR